MVFETTRLVIRRATSAPEDIDMYFRLWNCPQVMANVGFPQGLGITEEEIARQFREAGDSVYDSRLLVQRKADGAMIGECKLGAPDRKGVSETDVKLFPEYWNQGYGTEIKQGLVDYLFLREPRCLAVKADPAKSNIGSQRMQEKVGARRIERGQRYPVGDPEKYFPNERHFLYMVFREDWERMQGCGGL